MEEMWLARDANNELYLFIDEVPHKKKEKNGQVEYSQLLLRYQNVIFPKCNGRKLSRLRLNLK